MSHWPQRGWPSHTLAALVKRPFNSYKRNIDLCLRASFLLPSAICLVSGISVTQSGPHACYYLYTRTQNPCGQYVAESIRMRKTQFFPPVRLLYFHTNHFLVDTYYHQMCGGFSTHHQAVLCNTSWVAYNLTQFWCCLPETASEPTG